LLKLLTSNFQTQFSVTFLQSIVGVSGGATRAALTQHQARRNNMADVSAKDGSRVQVLNHTTTKRL